MRYKGIFWGSYYIPIRKNCIYLETQTGKVKQFLRPAAMVGRKAGFSVASKFSSDIVKQCIMAVLNKTLQIEKLEK